MMGRGELAKMHSIMKLNFLVKRKQNIMQTNVDGIETFAQIFMEEYSPGFINQHLFRITKENIQMTSSN